MGLVLAVIAGIITLAVVLLITIGNACIPAPTSDNTTNPLPALLIGAAITAFLAFTHFHPLDLHW